MLFAGQLILLFGAAVSSAVMLIVRVAFSRMSPPVGQESVFVAVSVIVLRWILALPAAAVLLFFATWAFDGPISYMPFARSFCFAGFVLGWLTFADLLQRRWAIPLFAATAFLVVGLILGALDERSARQACEAEGGFWDGWHYLNPEIGPCSAGG